MSLVSQELLTHVNALIQRYKTYLICLSFTHNRLSGAVWHINYQAYNITIKILYFYTI